MSGQTRYTGNTRSTPSYNPKPNNVAPPGIPPTITGSPGIPISYGKPNKK